MPELSRAQVVVYGAIAVALLLVGARAIRSEGGGRAVLRGRLAAAESARIGIRVGRRLHAQRPGLRPGRRRRPARWQRPGVYRLPAGSRVEDAVERAGGAGAEAELEAVNLAARLADGQQVVVPERGPAALPSRSAAAKKTGRSASAPPRSSSSTRSTGSGR